MLSWLDFTVPTINRSPDQAQASTPNAGNEASLEQGQAPGTEAWITTLQAGGRVAMIVPEADTSGWSSPPGSTFLLRGPDYMTSKRKIHAGESLLHPLAFDWLASEARIDNILEHPNSRVMLALDKVVKASPSTGQPKPFVWVFNLQVRRPLYIQNSSSHTEYFLTPCVHVHLLHRKYESLHGDIHLQGQLLQC